MSEKIGNINTLHHQIILDLDVFLNGSALIGEAVRPEWVKGFQRGSEEIRNRFLKAMERDELVYVRKDLKK